MLIFEQHYKVINSQIQPKIKL